MAARGINSSLSRYLSGILMRLKIFLLVFPSHFLSCYAGVAADAESCLAQRNFAWVAAGSAIVGSDQAERDKAYQLSALPMAKTDEGRKKEEIDLRQEGWFDREEPRHGLDYQGFCISKFLVTNSDYYDFVVATGHRQPSISEVDYTKQGFLVHSYDEVLPYLWHNGQFPAGRAKYPAVLISYDDAAAFAKWFSQIHGHSYRLPKATEWEIAARGTGGNLFSWGNEWDEAACNWSGSGVPGTSAVEAFPRCVSPFGLHDTAGNVFEYTLIEKEEAREVLMKGCGWDDLPGFCRPAYQHYRPRGSRHILFGFRLIME